MQSLKRLFLNMKENQKIMELLRYLVIGVLTTLVGYGSFWILVYPIGMEPNTGNFISINLAIIFAFFTNKSFVFKNRSENFKQWLKAFVKFYGSRGLSIVVEMIGVWTCLSLLKFSPMVSKILIGFIVVLLNYFVSKYFVFKE